MASHRADLQWVTLGDAPPVALGTAGARLLARLLDGSLLGVPYAIVVAAFFGGAHGVKGLTAALLGFVVLLVVYDVVMTALRGGTVGKRITGVVVADTGGGRAAVSKLVLRSLVLFGPVFVPGLGALYLLCCVVSAVRDEQTRRGWHDRAAGTVVLTEP